MQPIYIVLIVVAVVVVLIAIWWISTSNGFKRRKIKTEESLSGIEVALTKRYDLLTKMLDVTKGYAAHEKETLAETVKMRRGMSVQELNEAGTQIDNFASRIFAVAEAYPQLRASENFKELQDAVRDAEEHLQAARRLYNSNVTAFNTAIALFPGSIVAGAQHLTPMEFFVAEERKRQDVEMKF